MPEQTTQEATWNEKSSEQSNLDSHFLGYPDPKKSFELFRPDWEHFKLEENDGELQLSVERVKDPFISFCANLYGGFEGKNILELGPYEGFHSCALANAGAKVTSIEANPRNFLKCLIVKNHFELDQVKFRLGNFASYLEDKPPKYDFVLAAGVMYHLSRPFEVLDRIMEVTDAFGICTTYYDENNKRFEFTGETREVHLPGAEPFVLHQRPNAAGTKKRKQGIDSHAWMFSKPDFLRYLECRGFEYEEKETMARPNLGPRFQLYAQRKK